MTIDRVIKDLKGEFSSPYNNQLAEWLEELKELREANRTLSLGEGHFITEDNLDKSIDNAYLKGYNKAIDDFREELLKADNSAIPQYCQAEFYEGNCKKCTSEIYKIAEQLKRAKQNED